MPRLLLVDGRFIVMPDVSVGRQPGYGRHSSRKSSRRSSRRSSQLHNVSRDTDVNVTPVTECDSNDVINDAADAAGAADAYESTADHGLCSCCLVNRV